MLGELPGAAEWRPILARELPGQAAAELEHTDDAAEEPERERIAQREQIAQRARELGLQPLRWPQPFPFDSTLAMLAATYAQQIGRTVPFAQAAFRQAFAGGRSLAEENSVLIAAAACEMHPAAVLRAVAMRGVANQLRRTTAQALQDGVRSVPAVAVGPAVFHGEHELHAAASCMAVTAGAREDDA